MLKKIHRLKSKDINYLYKKQKIIHTRYFSFFYFPQYPNKKFNQVSMQISTKISKNAVMRNLLRRTAYDLTSYQISLPINNNFYKIFGFVSKNGVELLLQAIESKDKKFIRNQFSNIFKQDFNFFIKKLGNL